MKGDKLQMTLKLALLNLMPNKVETEIQFLKQLDHSPLKLEVKLVRLKSHRYKGISSTYLDSHYSYFHEVKEVGIDGLIITGAPLEKLAFEEVDYWNELQEIMDYAVVNISSTLYICWGAVAGLYHHYGIPKRLMDHKIFGVFHHRIKEQLNLFQGIYDGFTAPHSRYFSVDEKEILKRNELEIIAGSDEVGVLVVASKEGKQVLF